MPKQNGTSYDLFLRWRIALVAALKRGLADTIAFFGITAIAAALFLRALSSKNWADTLSNWLVIAGVILLPVAAIIFIIQLLRRALRGKGKGRAGVTSPKPSGRVMAWRVAVILVSLFLLVFGLNYWRFKRWGLPWDLRIRQTQLKTLRLATRITGLAWLDDGLETVELTGADVSDLRRLPKKLRTFGLRDSTVNFGWALQDSIAQLDLRGTTVKVRHWPTSLQELKQAGKMVDRLEPSMLPLQLTHLVLESDNCQADVLERLPRSIIDLELDCRNLRRLRRLPPNLRTLALLNTQLESLDGVLEVDTLRRLVLVNNAYLQEIERLPVNLEEFYIERTRAPKVGILRTSQLMELSVDWAIGVDELPDTLTALSVLGFTGKEVGSIGTDIHLPARLSSLKIPPSVLPTITGWNKIRCLDLGFDPAPVPFHALPRSLEVLRTGMKVGEAHWGLPEKLKTLQLREWDDARLGTRNLSWVPPTVTRLEIDWLKGDGIVRLPSKLEELVLVHAETLVELPNLDKLPLRVLSLSGTGISKLPRLPSGLEKLDIAGTKITSLRGLPRKLQTLRLAPNQVTTLWGLWGLPDSVTELSFEESEGGGVADPAWSIDVCGKRSQDP